MVGTFGLGFKFIIQISVKLPKELHINFNTVVVLGSQQQISSGAGFMPFLMQSLPLSVWVGTVINYKI